MKISHIQKSNQNVNISGQVSGKIHDLNIDDLFIGMSENLYVRSDLKIKGLPQIDSLFFDVNIAEGMTSKDELDKINFLDFGLDSDVKLPDIINKFGLVDLKGNFVGSLKNYKSKIQQNRRILQILK